ncbi:hypothetical protein [Cupriavidus sp. UYPR2.512]|uniref:hypothetical protein n=1 Tax=Cupriavidus sp. UYPR2.512 TaxID=1080187 RepID=UPI00037A2689|nr:hypothetical protein [Cupriavidus sp. UYPR2.512]UIF90897.1 hypothetical protein KAF44_32440 [Cupriavidus necator]
MPKTIEIKGFIHARISSWKPEAPQYEFFSSEDMSGLNSKNTTYVMVKPVTFAVEIPDTALDYRTARIAALEKEEITIRAHLARRVAEIREEVSRLTAIECTPAEVSA